MRYLLVTLIGLLALPGCTVFREADMVPANDAAEAAGIPKIGLVLYGTGYGSATVTMPDGDVLNGHYRLAVGGAVATGFGITSGPRGTAFASSSSGVTPMQNPFTLQAAGRGGSTMTCEGSAGGLGHGDAVSSACGPGRYPDD
jgi:hypothetical protein